MAKTPQQKLVAQRAALAQSRANLASVAVTVKGVSLSAEGAKQGAKAALKAQSLTHITGTHHALGTRETSVKLGRPKVPSKYKNSLGIGSVRTPSGVFKKVPKRIAPGSYLSRTGWRRSRAHKLKHHLKIRHKRPTVVKHWRRHRGSIKPR